MLKTTNYDLNKPESNDTVDITKINENMDIVDKELKSNVDKIAVLNGLGDVKEKLNKVDFDTFKTSNAEQLADMSTDYTKQTPYAGTTTGTANNYVINTPIITELKEGMSVCVRIHTSSTGISTLNWCGTGAKGITSSDYYSVNPLKSSGFYTLRFDGAQFIMQGADARATETTTGVVELATTAEVTAGTDTGRAVTPKGLKDQGYFNQNNYGSPIYSNSAKTLQLSDANKAFHGGGTITIPVSVFLAGTQITFVNYNGIFTFVPGSGVYLYSKDSKRTIDGDFGSATLVFLSHSVCVIIGALK